MTDIDSDCDPTGCAAGARLLNASKRLWTDPALSRFLTLSGELSRGSGKLGLAFMSELARSTIEGDLDGGRGALFRTEKNEEDAVLAPGEAAPLVASGD